MSGWAWFGMTAAAILLLGILALTAWAMAPQPGAARRRKPYGQLAARLAKGEIDTQEYRKHSDDRSGHDVGA